MASLADLAGAPSVSAGRRSAVKHAKSFPFDFDDALFESEAKPKKQATKRASTPSQSFQPSGLGKSLPKSDMASMQRHSYSAAPTKHDDASFDDDDMLKELMEQNEKLEQELASRDPPARDSATAAATVPAKFNQLVASESVGQPVKSAVESTGAGANVSAPRIRKSTPELTMEKQNPTAHKSELDSFLNDFVSADKPPMRDSPQPNQRAPAKDQPEAAIADPAGQAEHKLASNAFTAEWSPPPRRASRHQSKNSPSPAQADKKSPDILADLLPPSSDTKNRVSPRASAAKKPNDILDDLLPPPSESAPSSAASPLPSPRESARVATPSPAPIPYTADSLPLGASAATSTPPVETVRPRERRASVAPAVTIVEDPVIFRPQPSVPATGATSDLRSEIGRLTGQLAAADAKAKRLQEEIDACLTEKRKAVQAVEEERAGDRERWDAHQKRLETDIRRLHDSVTEEHRRFGDLKTRQKDLANAERDELKREWQQKLREEQSRLKKIFEEEREQLIDRHRRQTESLVEQHARECESLRLQTRSAADFTNVLDRMADNAQQIDHVARRLDNSHTATEDTVKLQLDIRERNLKQLERNAEEKLAEVERQRRKMTEVLDKLNDDRSNSDAQFAQERERLERDHARVLELLASTKEKERTASQRLSEERCLLEEEKRNCRMETEQGRIELANAKAEHEASRKKTTRDREHLEHMRRQIDTALSNCERRITESETVVACERRNLMIDLEVVAERERHLKENIAMWDERQRKMELDQLQIEDDTKRVTLFAAEVERKSQDICQLYEIATSAQETSQRMQSEINDSKKHIVAEKQNLQSLHTLVEHQRLQLMQDTTMKYTHDVAPLPHCDPILQPREPSIYQDARMTMAAPNKVSSMLTTSMWAQPPASIVRREELEMQLAESFRAREHTQRITRTHVGRDTPNVPRVSLPVRGNISDDGMNTPPLMPNSGLVPSYSLCTLDPLPSDDGLMA